MIASGRFVLDRQNERQSILMKKMNRVRKLVVIIVCLFAIVTVSFGQPENFRRIANEAVPTSTAIKFYDAFKGAEDVVWFATADTGTPKYRADYNFQGKVISLTFNADNQIIKEVRASKRIPVPVGVEEYFATHYKGFKLFKVSKVCVMDPQGLEPPQVYFELDVKKGDRVILFRFEEDHEMFRGVDLALGSFTSN